MNARAEAKIGHRNKALHSICPHCGVSAGIYGSRQVTRTYKQFYLVCRNPECGFSWLAEVTVVHGITPSAIPNPSIHIPMGPTFAQLVQRGLPHGHDPPANDDSPPAPIAAG